METLRFFEKFPVLGTLRFFENFPVLGDFEIFNIPLCVGSVLEDFDFSIFPYWGPSKILPV